MRLTAIVALVAMTGETTTKRQLALLYHWLCDDDDCAYMALDLLADQWLDPVHIALFQVLRAMPPEHGAGFQLIG